MSALLDRVGQACDVLLEGGADEVPAFGATVREVHGALAEPVRVAVVGRVKAGKSTLVNALVGRQVAPTRAGECTRVVTWYRYGSPDRAELVLTDGARVRLAFSGRLPEELPVPLEQVDRLEVHLQAGALRRMTLLDTPGIGTTSVPHEAATRRAVLGERSSVSAASQADAVLFLFRESERDQDVAFLQDFLQASGEAGGTALHALGLLSHADLLGDGPWSPQDPLEVAAAQAARLAATRRAEVADVLPVAGLMAETTRTGRLREADARVLASLAGLPDVRLRLWEQLGPPEGVEPEQLRRLFGLLSPYGVARGRTHASADRLLSWLEDSSGLARVEAAVRARFVDRADLLKADRALAVLERAAVDLPARLGGLVRDLVEQARLDPVLHPLREVRALGLLARHAPDSPLLPTLTDLLLGGPAVRRLGLPDGSAPALVASVARRRAADAQAAASLASSSAEAEAARTAARSFVLMARSA